MFADDTTVIKERRRTDSLIGEDVKVMTHQFDANKLTINVDKCEAIHLIPAEAYLMKFRSKTLSCITNPVVSI